MNRIIIYSLLLVDLLNVAFAKEEEDGKNCVRFILAPDGTVLKKDVLPETTDTDCRKRAQELLLSVTTSKKCLFKSKTVDAIKWKNAGGKQNLVPCKFGSILANSQDIEKAPSSKNEDDPFTLILDKAQKKKLAEAILNPKLKKHQPKFRALQAIANSKTPEYIQKKFKINNEKLKNLIEVYKADGIRGIIAEK